MKRHVRLATWMMLALSGGVPLMAAGPRNSAQPTEVDFVSAGFSDYGLIYYYRLTEVRQDGPDVVIRYTRIAPEDPLCPHYLVKTVEARLRNTTVLARLQGHNPCDVRQQDVDRAAKRYSHGCCGLESASVGVTTQCGDQTVTLALPSTADVDWDRITRHQPAVGRLFHLAFQMQNVFGNQDVLQDRPEAEDLQQQEYAARVMVPDLLAGRFDAVLAASRTRVTTFRSLLNDYRGPVPLSVSRRGPIPELVDAGQYRFEHFAAPKYPQLAKQARIIGPVVLALRVTRESGEVASVAVVSGHPLLAASALEAARQWRFAAGSVDAETLQVRLNYQLTCP